MKVCTTVLTIIGAVAPLAIATARASAVGANPNLKMLLFYTCVTPQVGNQCEEVNLNTFDFTLSDLLYACAHRSSLA